MEIEPLLSTTFDCLILTNPQVQVLNKVRERIHVIGIQEISVNDLLSQQLISIPLKERGKVAQDWLMSVLLEDTNEPLLLANSDLIFHPSLGIDSFELIRKLSRFQKLIILWPGNYQGNLLSYAIPGHHHYRVWKTSAPLLIYPKILIHQLN